VGDGGELYERIVDALNGVFGSHAGYRAVHAKGSFCSGTFTAAPEAAELTTAAHMQGDGVETLIRFSNASGDPAIPDYARQGQGMAVQFKLPDGGETDILGVTVPAFVARTPEDFLALNHARKPDPETGQPDMEKVGAYLGGHPEALPAVQHTLETPPPESYLRLRYNALHAFKWTNSDGEARWVRYSWHPEAEAKERGGDYLRDDLVDRLAGGTAAFSLLLQLAEDGDPLDDPTAAWPEERKTVTVGRLEVTEAIDDPEAGGELVVFDPTRVTEGIETSDDPILHARPRAYSVSVERRSAGDAAA
jgi:catalase